MKLKKAALSQIVGIWAIINHNTLKLTALAFNCNKWSMLGLPGENCKEFLKSEKLAIKILSSLKHNGRGQGLYQGE